MIVISWYNYTKALLRLSQERLNFTSTTTFYCRVKNLLCQTKQKVRLLFCIHPSTSLKLLYVLTCSKFLSSVYVRYIRYIYIYIVCRYFIFLHTRFVILLLFSSSFEKRIFRQFMVWNAGKINFPRGREYMVRKDKPVKYNRPSHFEVIEKKKKKNWGKNSATWRRCILILKRAPAKRGNLICRNWNKRNREQCVTYVPKTEPYKWWIERAVRIVLAKIYIAKRVARFFSPDFWILLKPWNAARRNHDEGKEERREDGSVSQLQIHANSESRETTRRNNVVQRYFI